MTSLLLLLLVLSDLTNSEEVVFSADDTKVFPDPPRQPGNGSKGATTYVAGPHTGEVTQQVPQGDRSGRSVDNVLAALVDYSKDPKLWRFVHSVVGELDYSLRASHPHSTALPPHSRPVARLSRPNFHWGNITGPKHDAGHGNTQATDENYSSDNNPTTTTTTTTPLLLPWLQQPPEEPFAGGAQRTQETQGNTPPVEERLRRVNFVKSPPSPSTHFFFHRVFLDKTFDNRTRQPYRRPVLALTAREISAAKSSTDGKGDLQATNQTDWTPSRGNSTKELPDKFNSLSPPESRNDSEGGDETGGDGDEGKVFEATYNHHHRHRLHTLKSQLQYFQRWEERLWRRSHQHHDQHHQHHHQDKEHHHHHHNHHHHQPGL